MNEQNLVRVRVWGGRACFTVPAHKVERYSYPVLTPSAARGIVESIYWHPQIAWLIRAVWVLNPLQYGDPLLRNEVKSTFLFSRAVQQVEGVGIGYCADQDRTQRYTVGLVDVDYVIVAECVPRREGEDLTKHVAIFNRRVREGAVRTQPYFGLREYIAWVEPVTGNERPIPVDLDIGSMLLDMSYDPEQPGRGIPIFFDAHLDQGILHVPRAKYEEVFGLAKIARCSTIPHSRGQALEECRHSSSTQFKSHEEALALVLERLQHVREADVTRRLWSDLYLYLRREPNVERVVNWVRDTARRLEQPSQGLQRDPVGANRRGRQRAAIYWQMAALMKKRE
jgi:CRISPR-associated protein Cas5d